MTEEQLRIAYERVKKFIADERAMRQVVFGRDPTKLARKLKDCSEALQALGAIKDVAKLATEEGPEQVMLFDDLPRERGGY